MLSLYTFQMPPAIQTWLMRRTAQMPGGNHVGVFGMGALSALIVGPCVAAPLAGALIYIGQTGDAALGAAALFAMALGMGTPLLFIGFSAGALLPRVGQWMDSIKRFFGFALIAVALWLISPFLPGWLAHVLGAVLLACAVFGLKLWPKSGPGKWPDSVLRRGATVMILLIATAWGVSSLLPALEGQRGSSFLLSANVDPQPVKAKPAFERVVNVADLERHLINPGRPVMLDFYADWCVSCKEMERQTLSDPRVAARLTGFRLLQADVTANSEMDRELLKRFGLFGPPGILFFDAEGKSIEGTRVVGFQNAQRFLNVLNRVEAAARSSQLTFGSP